MRRRGSAPALTVEDMPPHLCEFDPVAWGWSGPHCLGGLLATGYREAWSRFLEQRRAWCDEHPVSDWLEDVLRRHPDEPWGLWS